MLLPNSLCEITGLTANHSTTVDLFTQLSTVHHDALDGLLTSDESQVAAATSLEKLPKYRLRIEDQVGALQYKFCSVNIGNHPDPILVGLIADGQVDAPPTELENLIFWAILDSRLLGQQLDRIDDDRKCVDWRNIIKGRAIIAEPIELQLDIASQQVISALFGLSYPGMPSVTLPGSLVSSATAVNLEPLASGYSPVQALLLHETSTEQHPKWRFLSLYRILENAYLTNIKTALLSEFDQDASKAIKSADKKLANEPNQLASLAEGIDAITEFEAFNTAFESLISAQNKYIIKLDKAAENEDLYKSPDSYKKAVIRFYKIRCSIAHAGTSSVIYEKFPDANSVIVTLLPYVERIALKSLKITAV